MNHINIFLNNNIAIENVSFKNLPVALGDWFLTPVRCLFDGNQITIKYKNDIVRIQTEKEMKWYQPKRNIIRVIVSIVLIIPGLIIGCAFKGLGYLFESIRERHKLAILHHTPVDRIVGSEEERLSLEEIKVQLLKLVLNKCCTLNQPTKNLIIYAEEGVEIKEDPGILGDFDPQKLILIGARLVHGPTKSLDQSCMDKKLGSEWEKKPESKVKDAELLEGSFATQWKVKSLAAALEDVPPRRSLFSFERYHRIYVV